MLPARSFPDRVRRRPSHSLIDQADGGRSPGLDLDVAAAAGHTRVPTEGAPRVEVTETVGMADWTRFFVLFGGLIMMVGLAFALRWTWGTGKELPGPRVIDPDDPTGDGLLEEVARVPTEPAAQVLRNRLLANGIRATVGRREDGYGLLVFPADLVNAKLVLSRSALE